MAKTTTKKEVAVIDDDDTNPFIEYGNVAGSTTTIIGKLLKFSKGEYVAGQDEEEVPIGTRVAVNMGSVLIGWQRWQDNRPVEQAMGPVLERFQIAQRSDLGHDDQSEWEVGTDGKKRDPWQLSNLALMKATDKSGQLYTFTTNSKGGIGAIGRLCKAYGIGMREHSGKYPVIELEVDTYKHPDYGKIPFPVFNIVDWVSASIFDDDAVEKKPERKKLKAR